MILLSTEGKNDSVPCMWNFNTGKNYEASPPYEYVLSRYTYTVPYVLYESSVRRYRVHVAFAQRHCLRSIVCGQRLSTPLRELMMLQRKKARGGHGQCSLQKIVKHAVMSWQWSFGNKQCGEGSAGAGDSDPRYRHRSLRPARCRKIGHRH